jgi:O-antigen/teichoic acid export membrane protein
MLRGFVLSGAVRAYAITAGLAVQVLLSNVVSKTAFGQINTFISTVLLLTFFATSAPTRHLVRELGTFGMAERGRLVEEFIGNAHLWVILSGAMAIIATILGQTNLALTIATVGIAFATSLYSAYFRGLGRYVMGNLEAGVIRTTSFMAILSIATLVGLQFSVVTTELWYLASVVTGLVVLMLARARWPLMEISARTLWPYGTLPITLTILAGLEIFFVNFDIIVTAYLYGPEVTAEVRVAQQLRSLTMLPLQVYLMFSLDRLSRTLRTGAETSVRRREIALIRVLLVGTFIAAVAVSGPFGNLFFEEGINFLVMIAVLSGVLPVVLFGPRAEVVIAAGSEREQAGKTITFALAYAVLTPVLCWMFSLPAVAYFFIQAALTAAFFASLPKKI